MKTTRPCSGAVAVMERISLLPGSGDLAAGSYDPSIPWIGGRVVDELSKYVGGNIHELQQFVGTVFGGIDVFPGNLGPVPLIIRELNGFEHGTLGINMYDNRVEISGVADVVNCK